MLTAVGPLRVRRTYYHCATCRQGEFGADRVLGLTEYVTPGARRIVALLATQHSFARVERTLAAVVGWELDDNTIRQLCHDTAQQLAVRREERATAETFATATATAQGTVDTEVQIDAGKVNTLDGWRDVKVAVYACRERGKPCPPATWDERELKPPLARAVLAAVESVSAFGPRCAAEKERLKLTDMEQLSVLGDGAEWVWNLAQDHFAGADQVLDFWLSISTVDSSYII